MKKTTMIVSIIVILSILLISGCTQQSENKQQTTVIIKNFAFNPENLTVKVGTTVTWINEDSVNHTVKSIDDLFKSKLESGQSFNYTFNATGTYNYICDIHPNMQGNIIVE
jgi:plastocyanin